MKAFIGQILFAITVLIATLSTSCAGNLQNSYGSAKDESREMKAALQKIGAEHQGIREDEYYIYSAKCWVSAMKSIAEEYAYDEARQQLEQLYPELDTSKSNTMQQYARYGNCTCALITISKKGPNNK